MIISEALQKPRSFSSKTHTDSLATDEELLELAATLELLTALELAAPEIALDLLLAVLDFDVLTDAPHRLPVTFGALAVPLA